MISPELHAKVLKKIKDCLVRCEVVLPIKVTYRTNMKRTAGTACFDTSEIELNVQLLNKYGDEFINRTVTHEVGHLVANKLWPRAKQAHGPEFRNVMSFLGGPTTTYHNYDTSVADPSRTYRYTCNCEKTFMLTKLLHKRVNAGQVRRCKSCGSKISYWPINEE